MNVELVKAATAVITRAQRQGMVTPAGFAIALDVAQLLQSPGIAAQVRSELVDGAAGMAKAVAELRRLRDRVAELEAELRIGTPWKCPACGKENRRDVCEICESDRPESDEDPIVREVPVDETPIAYELTDKAAAAETYPPALPWAALMDREDLADFLDELGASAITNASAEATLAEVEATCGRWRVIAEAQHAHNTAPGPDQGEMSDGGFTRLIVPLQALRADEAGDAS